MSRTHRFYCPELPLQVGAQVRIEDDEARHMLRVLRLREGAEVELFDGRGGGATARIVQGEEERAELQVLEVATQPPLARLVLAVAPPKKDFDELVTRLAEMGVACVIPLTTEHGEVKLTRRSDSLQERMHRLAVRAAKISGCNHLLQVREQTTLAQLTGRVLVCDTTGTTAPLSQELATIEGETIICVGPEGGFSETERRLFEERGWRRVSLPGFAMRTATAAICAAALALDHLR